MLDEPTVGLDPVLRADLWNQFGALARRGTTLLISSHVMDEADHCAELLLMREGRLLAHTTPTRLRGHRMHVTGASVPVSHPAHHRSPGLSPRISGYHGPDSAPVGGDHRGIAMILVVPSAVITLMYFMFQNVPTRPGVPTPSTRPA